MVSAICVPIVLAMLLGSFTDLGTGLGLAAGAVVVGGLLVFATRQQRDEEMEVAAGDDSERRLLVVTTVEPTTEAAQRIAERAGGATDVRVLVPLATRPINRWLSADDEARSDAERLLARSAGTLVAAGLPVSGSVGDADPVQAIEDELHAFAADEVLVLGPSGATDPLGGAEGRIGLPVAYVGV